MPPQKSVLFISHGVAMIATFEVGNQLDKFSGSRVFRAGRNNGVAGIRPSPSIINALRFGIAATVNDVLANLSCNVFAKDVNQPALKSVNRHSLHRLGDAKYLDDFVSCKG